MNSYVSQYFKLLRSGFLKESYKFLGLVFLLFIVLGSKISTDVEIIIFTFLGIGIFSDLDEKKYALATSLPMKVKTRIVMLYINTYVICFLGSVFIQVVSLIRGGSRSIVEALIVILASVIGCNLYYLIFASSEFKEDPQEQLGPMVGISIMLTIAGMMLSIIYLEGGFGILSSITQNLFIMYQIVFLVVLMHITVVINYLSYKKVTKETCIRDYL